MDPVMREEHKMLTDTEFRTLVKTRQRVLYKTFGGKEKGMTFLVIGPASDGTWMFKTLQDPAWTTVDTTGQCHNWYYQGHTRTVSTLELEAFKLHQTQLSQGVLF
jgi:hypothetical protein